MATSVEVLYTNCTVSHYVYYFQCEGKGCRGEGARLVYLLFIALES